MKLVCMPPYQCNEVNYQDLSAGLSIAEDPDTTEEISGQSQKLWN